MTKFCYQQCQRNHYAKENEVVTFTEEILNGKLYFLVLWIQSSQNRLKLIQYFKDKIVSTWELFPQETHSSSKVEQKWKENFKDNVFFFSRKNKFLWCPNCLLEKKLLLLKRKETDKEGRILILEVCIKSVLMIQIRSWLIYILLKLKKNKSIYWLRYYF